MTHSDSDRATQTFEGEYDAETKRAFYMQRDKWAQQVVHDRFLKPRARLFAAILAYRGFSLREFVETEGRLQAWPSGRTLKKWTGMSRRTCQLAGDDLHWRGHLWIADRERDNGGDTSKLYHALFYDHLPPEQRGVYVPPKGRRSRDAYPWD